VELAGISFCASVVIPTPVLPMKNLPLVFSLAAVLLIPSLAYAAEVTPAASTNTTVASSVAAPATTAATASATSASAPRAASGRGRGGAPATATNHVEVPAKGAIWMPSPNPASVGNYPYGPDSVVQDGVPQGTFEKFTHTSSIVYPGIMRRVWIYVPAQYDAKVPACLMVVQDGVMQYAGRVADPTLGITPEYRVPTVIDNLIARKELPVIISVFIDSGSTTLGDTGRPVKQNRSIEYDTVSDAYDQFLTKEILPEVEKKYNIRKDPAGRAIIGISSGAICAFNVAWNHPDQFGKVLSDVGSFTNIRGGNVFPSLVQAADKKPIKVFLSDGVNDNRSPQDPTRDWYLQNKAMYEALRDKGYDVRYVLGENIHGSKLGGPIFPDSLRWLWSDQLPKAATDTTAPASPTITTTAATQPATGNATPAPSAIPATAALAK
jgi:enterochelin esterase family protein